MRQFEDIIGSRLEEVDEEIVATAYRAHKHEGGRRNSNILVQRSDNLLNNQHSKISSSSSFCSCSPLGHFLLM